METKLAILGRFFEDPNKKFGIRELSRILHINHTTVRQYLTKFVEQGLLTVKKDGVYAYFRLVFSRTTRNLKLYYNLEKIRESGILEDLEKKYDLPVIVLFGSYATASDDRTSDVDICLLSNIEKEFNAKKYEVKLHRRISLHKFSNATWKNMKLTNPHLINSICNGIVLSGELEVL